MPVTAQPEQSTPTSPAAPPTTTHMQLHPHAHAPVPTPYAYPQGAPYMLYSYGPHLTPYQPLYSLNAGIVQVTLCSIRKFTLRDCFLDWNQIQKITLCVPDWEKY